jgi:Uncharacterized protein conserved in bacteria
MVEEFDPMAVYGGGAAASERKKREPAQEQPTPNVAADQLRAFVERIEHLEEEKKEIADFIKDVYGEAKALGFDTKTLKKVVKIRKMGEAKWREEETILDTYLVALGMIGEG